MLIFLFIFFADPHCTALYWEVKIVILLHILWNPITIVLWSACHPASLIQTLQSFHQ
ncbi:hypothetical protein QJS04_geneDACA015685 [Acorus gramineus]|uniref:Uncharacterized protein n=1 Tax=Acorus gramineus TaxID=55184 RepID=A0AAV9AKB4_ACOGR|nr:hypothetical protein QJS04_geneDACA015685 [Acorus gramineus]